MKKLDLGWKIYEGGKKIHGKSGFNRTRVRMRRESEPWLGSLFKFWCFLHHGHLDTWLILDKLIFWQHIFQNFIEV